MPTLPYVLTDADQVHLELLEVLELYCETLHARFALLELKKYAAFDFFFSCAFTYTVYLVSTEPDDAIREPMLAVIHAAHRTELQELHVLKDMLSARYGSEFADAALENPDGRVPERITRKLAFSMPSPELVDAYLTESMCDSAGKGRLTSLFFLSFFLCSLQSVPSSSTWRGRFSKCNGHGSFLLTRYLHDLICTGIHTSYRPRTCAYRCNSVTSTGQ